MSRAAAVVVHHKNYPDVLDTIHDIVGQGVDPTDLILVDNSEDDSIRDHLNSLRSTGVTLAFTPNAGYGAAANHGIRWVLRNRPKSDFIIVSTHEVRLRRDSLSSLAQHLDTNPSCGVAAPVLVMKGTESVWSTGGYLKAVSGRPFHNTIVPDEPAACAWVDGAIAVYRADALRENEFDETFFMYYEETDLHMRLGKQGWGIAVVPSAVAEQTTGGAPPFYVGRNSYLFTRRHGGRMGTAITLAREGVRLALRAGRPNRRGDTVVSYLAGVRDGIYTYSH